MPSLKSQVIKLFVPLFAVRTVQVTWHLRLATCDSSTNYNLTKQPPQVFPRVDKEVFLDLDFVRQNPMLAIDVDKAEFVEELLCLQ